MGQAASSGSPRAEGDLLYDIFNNSAIAQFLVANGKFRHTPASGKDQGPAYLPDSSEEEFGLQSEENKKYNAGRWVWYRNLHYPGKVQDFNQKEVAAKLNSLLHDLGEQSGSSQLLKDPAFDRRIDFLEGQYVTMSEKAENLKEGNLVSLEEIRQRESSDSGTPLPLGIKLSFSTSIRVVLALLQHNVRTSPTLCTSILDIFVDALKQLPPLSLNESELGADNFERKPYLGILSEGLKIVDSFLVETVQAFSESQDKEGQTIRIRAIEALIGLAFASGSLSNCLSVVNLLLKLDEEERAGKPAVELRVAPILRQLKDSRESIKRKWKERDETEEEKDKADWLKVPIPEDDLTPLKPWQVVAVLFAHISELVNFMVNSSKLEADTEGDKPHAKKVTFPFSLELHADTFKSIFAILANAKEEALKSAGKGKEKESDNRSQLFEYILFAGLKLLNLNLRQLAGNRVAAKDVGLEWAKGEKEEDEKPETPVAPSLVSNLSALLRGFIFDASESFNEAIGNEACEGLAIALDYFLPSQQAQADLLLNALRERSQAAKDGVALSSARKAFLNQLVEQFSDPALMYRLVSSFDKNTEKDLFSELLELAFSYAKEETDNKLSASFETVIAAELPKKKPPSLRFLMSLQNCVFFAACINNNTITLPGEEEEEKKEKSAEQLAAQAAVLKRIQTYIFSALQHFHDSLVIVDAYLHKYIAEQKASKADQPLEGEPIKKFVGLLGQSTSLALLPPLASSLLLGNRSEEGENDEESKEGKELTDKLLAAVLGVLQLVGKIHDTLVNEGLGGLFGREFTRKRVTTVETPHPYSNDMDVDGSVIHADAQELVVEFADEVATEDTHDYLFFYLEPNRGNQIGDKMCGPHYKWPTKPIHIPGGSLFYWFHSDGSTVDWGIKFTVTSWARRRVWISELERTLVWIFAKTALKKLGTVHPIENTCGKWLRSNLLKSGREADAKALDDKDQWAKEREFLEDLIEKRNEAGKFHSKMTGGGLSSSAAQLSTITSASVEKAIRAVIAAILKHTQLTATAMNVAANKTQPPSQLKKAYRYGFRVKKWFIQQKQKGADSGVTYDSLSDLVVAKAKLLLDFVPNTSRRKGDTKMTLARRPSASLKRSIDRIIQQNKPSSGPVYIGVNDDDDIHAKWDGPDAAIWHWEPAAKAILAFVQSDITIDNIDKAITIRKQRALDRVDCLNTLNNLIANVTQPLLPDVLSFVSLALKGYSAATPILNPKKSKKGKALAPAAALPEVQHYSQDLLASGQTLQSAVAEALYPLLQKLIALRSEAQTTSAVEANLLLLDALALRFQTEEDFNFLRSVKIFEWLAPLLFSDKYDNVEKTEEEKQKEAKEKAEKEERERKEKEEQEAKEKAEREAKEKAEQEAEEKEKEKEPETVEGSSSTPSTDGGEGSSADGDGDEGSSEGGRRKRPLSDSDYARQLQAEFDSENGDSGLFGGDDADTPTTPPLGRRSSSLRSSLRLSTAGLGSSSPRPVDENESGRSSSTQASPLASPTLTPRTPRLSDAAASSEETANEESSSSSSSSEESSSSPRRRNLDRIWIVTPSMMDQIPEDERPQEGQVPQINEEDVQEDPEEFRAETKKKLRDLLRKQRRAAWDLFKFLALQCVTPSVSTDAPHTVVEEKGKEKEGKEEGKLYPAQKDLVQEFLGVLLTQLSKPLTADKGLLPVKQSDEDAVKDESDIRLSSADIALFLHVISNATLVKQYLTEAAWVSLLLALAKGSHPVADESVTKEGVVTFVQLLAIRLLSAALPALDPLSNTHAQDVAHFFLQQAGEGLAGLAFSHVKKSSSSSADNKGKGKEKEEEKEQEKKEQEEEKDISAKLYKSAIVSQVVVTSLRTLLFSDSPSATNWRLHLSKWLGRVASQDLPRVVPLLSDAANPVEAAAASATKNETVESFHEILALLSLLGGNISTPLPGTKVELNGGARRRGCVVGLKSKEDGLVLAVSLEDKKWEYNVVPEQAIQIHEEQENADLASIQLEEVVGHLIAFLPTLVSASPNKSLLSNNLYYQIQRMAVKSLSNFLNVPTIHQKLLENTEALQALAKLATQNAIDDKKLKSVRKIERRVFSLELQVLHNADKSRTATRNTIAAELTEVTGANLSQALIALEQCSDDKHAAFKLLKEEKQGTKKELKESENALSGEFGPVLDSYLWSAKAYSQMSGNDTQSQAQEVNLAGNQAPGPAWYQLLEASKALGNRYAVEIVFSLLQEIHSRFLTTESVDESIAEPVKQGLERLWQQVRQPDVLSKLLDSLLVLHTNKLKADVKQLAADLVIQSTKPSILPQGSAVETSAETPKKALGLIASEAVSAFNGLAKEVRKLRCHCEESLHPYENDQNYEKTIELKGVSSILIVWDKETKTENNYDWVRLKDFKTKEIIVQFSGEYSNFRTVLIPSNKFILNFYSDGSNNFWGYKFFALGLAGGEPGETVVNLEHAISTLELVLHISERGSLELQEIYKEQTLTTLIAALKSCLEPTMRNRIVLLLRSFLHPKVWSLYQPKPDLNRLLQLLMGIATRLYNTQKDDVVLSQSLQALIELIVLCFNHLDEDNYSPKSWLNIAGQDNVLDLLNEVSWTRGIALNGHKHAAAFETETQVATFKEGRQLVLSTTPAAAEKAEVKADQEEKGGWTLAAWIQLPLPETRNYNTLVEFANGDKICVDHSDSDSPTFGVLQKENKKFHPSGLNLPKPPRRQVSKGDAGTPEEHWHFLVVRGSPSTHHTKFTLDDGESEKQGASDYFIASPVIKAFGNAAEGNEQFGILDGVQIVPEVAWSVPQIASAFGVGLIKSNRSGPAKVVLDAAHKVNGAGTAENNVLASTAAGTTFVAPVLLRGGKWYYEVKLRSTGNMFIGWRGLSDDGSKATGDSESSFGFNGSEAVKRSNKDNNGYGSRWKLDDVVGVCIDLTPGNMNISYSLNNERMGTAFRDLKADLYSPSLTLENDQTVIVNWGAEKFLYCPPGYSPIDVSEVLKEGVHASAALQPPWIKRVSEFYHLLELFLTRQTLPRWVIEESISDREFLSFHPQLATLDVNDLYFDHLKNCNNNKWSLALDEQIVEVVNLLCAAKDYDPMDISPDVIAFSESLKLQYPTLAAIEHTSITARFYVLRALNRRFAGLGGYIDASRMNVEGQVTPSTIKEKGRSLAGLMYALRKLAFLNVKRDAIRRITAVSNTSREMPVFRFNRAKALKYAKDKKSNGLKSMFGQFFTLSSELSDVSQLRQSDRAWKVEFVGEGATDQGGPYRESLSQIAQELYNGAVPLLVPCPNNRVDVGNSRDKYIPCPSLDSPLFLSMFRALGMLIGIMIRTKNVYDIRFPSFVWKGYIGETTTFEDLEEFDLISAQLVRNIEGLDSEEAFDAVFDDLTFTTTLSDGKKVELKKGGANEVVTFDKRLEFTRLLVQARLGECAKQVEAMRRGTATIIPIDCLKVLSWREMENLVCGRPDFDVEWLKNRTSYSGSISASTPSIQKLWEVLTEFSPEERGSFLRFVYGQTRLPPSTGGYSQELTIETLERYGVLPDQMLPEAATCSFKLKFPLYTSKEILRTKMLYAITHCSAIDTDFTAATWAADDLQEVSDDEGEGPDPAAAAAAEGEEEYPGGGDEW